MLKTYIFVLIICVCVLHTSYAAKKGRGKKGKKGNKVKTGTDTVLADGEDYVTQQELDEAIAGVEAELNVVIAQMNSMNIQVQNSLSEINGQLDTLNSNMATVQSQQADERKPPPMFFGQLSDVAYYDNGEVYKFSKVQVNQGNHYNTGDGKFTCGPTGWYFFTFSLYAYRLTYDGDHDLYGRLLMDGNEVTVAYASNYMDGKDQWMNLQASTSVLIKCNEGQKVYVVGSDWGGSSAKTSSGDFAAMLVHEEE